MCRVWVFAGAILCYLLGSIPFGYIITRGLRNIDIRNHGSGNVGATNVFRVVGPIPGISVFILDMLKGLTAVIFIAGLVLRTEPCIDTTLLRLIYAVACVCGHNWTIFLNFKGGKGMATSAGVIIGLSLKIPSLGMIFLLCMGFWVLILLISGTVSLASIAAAFLLPIFMVVFNQSLELIIFAVALCLFAIYRHKTNISRLLRGEEKKFFRKP
ncbi:MAG: glycerol-3-phosphate 1-O-acyltransferase PlsY [Candidatus Omnitrophica bacterium]|nr:glycerol-3-phosphate 1-O-acyltransferase PlsY [Candidatus Omnitrophota bacterium]